MNEEINNGNANGHHIFNLKKVNQSDIIIERRQRRKNQRVLFAHPS
jgi:hypothetical protein